MDTKPRPSPRLRCRGDFATVTTAPSSGERKILR